jgi:hypothetical protein
LILIYSGDSIDLLDLMGKSGNEMRSLKFNVFILDDLLTLSFRKFRLFSFSCSISSSTYLVSLLTTRGVDSSKLGSEFLNFPKTIDLFDFYEIIGDSRV